jgi:hypothetical protein
VSTHTLSPDVAGISANLSTFLNVMPSTLNVIVGRGFGWAIPSSI